jgi:hypothetical protein
MVDFRLHRSHAFELDIERLLHHGDRFFERDETLGLRCGLEWSIASGCSERGGDPCHRVPVQF